MNELIEYISDSWDTILAALGEHVFLSVVPVALGLCCALPLGWWAARRPALSSFLLSMGGVAYSIPSIALFVLLPLVFGYQIISYINISYNSRARCTITQICCKNVIRTNIKVK